MNKIAVSLEEQQRQRQSEDLSLDLADRNINLNNDHQEEDVGENMKNGDGKTDMLLFEMKSLQVVNPITKKLTKIGEWMKLKEVDDDDDDDDDDGETLTKNYENYPYVDDDDDVDMY